MNLFPNKVILIKRIFTGTSKKFSIFAFLITLVSSNCSPSTPNLINTNKLPYFIGKDFDPVWYQNDPPKEEAKQIPDNLELISELGEISKASDWKQNTKVVVFFYATCKGICPMITRSLIQMAPKILEFPNTTIYSITINPKEDNQYVLQKYKKQYNIQFAQWKFFTGEELGILNFAKETCGGQVEAYSSLKDRFEFVHTENVFLFDEKNYLRGVYRAKGSGDLERLILDLTKLQGPSP